MTKRESRLVALLAAVLAVAAVAAAFVLQLERRSDVRQRIAAMEGELGRRDGTAADPVELVRERDALRAGLEEERRRFYGAAEMDTYRFGTMVRGQLLREGIDIDGYRTVEAAGRTWLEFTVTGGTLQIAKFLTRVSTSERRWIVPRLFLDAQGATGKLAAIFRIGYETIDGPDR